MELFIQLLLMMIIICIAFIFLNYSRKNWNNKKDLTYTLKLLEQGKETEISDDNTQQQFDDSEIMPNTAQRPLENDNIKHWKSIIIDFPDKNLML